jgi:AraC-like DNA-binding protein
LQPEPVSPLADLGFQLFPPGPPLRAYVSSYWHFRRAAPLAQVREEFMHPRGGFGIVFNFGDRQRLDGEAISDLVFLDGANTVSRRLGFTGRVELMGVRFHEGGAYPFLGVPLNELRNEVALMDALDGAGLRVLHARLYEAGSVTARVQLLEEWLIGQLARGATRDPLIPASLAMLRNPEGPRPIPHVAQELAISQRQLERLFLRQVGMSPKQYAQLVRVEAARLALKQAQGARAAGIAADMGYFDQAHFIREFSAVVGMTPQAYLQRNRRGAPQ